MSGGGAGCDVAIIGAGPAGAACAIALARASVDKVCLVAGGRRPGRRPAAIGETIPPDARLLLDRLGLWDAFLEEGHERCLGSCSAWGSDVLGYNDFLLNPQGSGWHLDRARFDAFLRRGARDAGASLVEEAGNRVERARFVVDATGRASAYARRRGARRIPLDRLTFVYGFFDAAGAVSRSRLTLLEAAEQGWWYAAALPDDRLAVAFACDADHVGAAGLAGDRRWLGAALATRHLAARLDGCRFLAGSIVSRVAASFRLDRVCGPDWLAVGDAAACFDPLAAQGIYKALEDGLAAAALIASALAEGGDLPGDYAAAAGARFDEYLAGRNYFYGLERRWPNSAFWRRRQARLDLPDAA